MSRFLYLARLVKEIYLFARAHKAYWILALILTLLVFALIVVSSESAAPFIYTLF